jgi:hypothetical protein
MGKMKKSKMYHTIMERNKPARKYLSAEIDYSKDEQKSEGSGYYQGEKVIVHSKKITKQNEEIFIDQLQSISGELISVTEYYYKYDGNGNLINHTIIENGEVINEEFYQYDKENKKVLEFSNDLNGNEYVTEIFYDEREREVELLFKINGELDVKVIYDYENNDKVIIERIYNTKMVLQSKSVSYYDVENNPIYKVNYDNAGDITSSMLNVYSGEKLLEYAVFDKDQTIEERKSYKYYEKTELIQQQITEYYAGGKLEKKEIYEWEYEFYDE